MSALHVILWSVHQPVMHLVQQWGLLLPLVWHVEPCSIAEAMMHNTTLPATMPLTHAVLFVQTRLLFEALVSFVVPHTGSFILAKLPVTLYSYDHQQHASEWTVGNALFAERDVLLAGCLALGNALRASPQPQALCCASQACHATVDPSCKPMRQDKHLSHHTCHCPSVWQQTAQDSQQGRG